MIAHLSGTLVSKTPACVVSVGGMGFEVHIPQKDRSRLPDISSEVVLHTFLYVREDRLTLFGFLTEADRELFIRLIEISGIGPKIALGILAEQDSGRIVHAVRTGDVSFLCTLPGLGRKTAERLVVELKDKLKHLPLEPAAKGRPVSIRDEALLALTSLGMTRIAAEQALEKIDWKAQNTESIAEIVKEALKHASGP